MLAPDRVVLQKVEDKERLTDVAAAIVVMQRGLTAVGHTVVLPVEEDCLG